MTETTLTAQMIADINTMKASGSRLTLTRVHDRWSLITTHSGTRHCYLFADFSELGPILRRLAEQ